MLFATTAYLTTFGLLAASVQAANHGKPGQRHQALVKKDTSLVKRDYSGIATFYNAETGQQGACGDGFIKNTDWSVAIKGDMYGDYGKKSYWCGKRLVITANGKTTTAVVRDACPGCQGSGGLDMTPSLFSFFISQDAGVVPITWHEEGAGAPAPAPEPSSSKWTPPPAPAWTPEPTPEWTPEWTPPAPAWTPEYTPSSSSWTPEWTPSSSSSSSFWTPEWTPEASSSSSWSSSSSSSSRRSSSSSSSSASATSSASAAARNATVTSGADLVNGTATLANSTLASVNATGAAARSGLNATSTLDLESAQASNGTTSTGSRSNGTSSRAGTAAAVGEGGNLSRTAQLILDLAGLAYAAGEHASK